MASAPAMQVVYPKEFRPSSRSLKDRSIIRAARKTFLKYGFDNASMDDIALDANVSKRTIYNRYSSKSELFHAVALKACEQVFSIKIGFCYETPIEKFLKRFAVASLQGKYNRDSIALHRLVTFQADKMPEIGQSYMEFAVQPIIDYLEEYLGQQSKNGLLKKNINTTQAAWAFIALIIQPMETKVMLGGVSAEGLEDEIYAHAKNGTEIFLSAFGPD